MIPEPLARGDTFTNPIVVNWLLAAFYTADTAEDRAAVVQAMERELRAFFHLSVWQITMSATVNHSRPQWWMHFAIDTTFVIRVEEGRMPVLAQGRSSSLLEAQNGSLLGKHGNTGCFPLRS